MAEKEVSTHIEIHYVMLITTVLKVLKVFIARATLNVLFIAGSLELNRKPKYKVNSTSKLKTVEFST